MTTYLAVVNEFMKSKNSNACTYAFYGKVVRSKVSCWCTLSSSYLFRPCVNQWTGVLGITFWNVLSKLKLRILEMNRFNLFIQHFSYLYFCHTINYFTVNIFSFTNLFNIISMQEYTLVQTTLVLDLPKRIHLLIIIFAITGWFIELEIGF